ncbi:SRPBCC family protein [bacterium]|nr:SRPBCC family protein [bacterium]
MSKITPPWLTFAIKTPTPMVMKTGALIDYTIRWFVIPIRWKTEIKDYNAPFLFVDEQIRGPYSFWYHAHIFNDVNGITEMTDLVHYRLPFGPLGRVAHTLLIRHQLQDIFDYRYNAIQEIFHGDRMAIINQ